MPVKWRSNIWDRIGTDTPAEYIALICRTSFSVRRCFVLILSNTPKTFETASFHYSPENHLSSLIKTGQTDRVIRRRNGVYMDRHRNTRNQSEYK
jgi:hypothetical protein